jgi:hypothetical protein
MALHHDHEHEHDNQPPPWLDDAEPCCPDEPGVRIRAITFDELDDYLQRLANPTQGPPWSAPATTSSTRASSSTMATPAPPP